MVLPDSNKASFGDSLVWADMTLQDEWKELYNERSALVHGRKDYDVDEVVRLADRASILARTLVLAALSEQGIRPPSHTDLSRDD